MALQEVKTCHVILVGNILYHWRTEASCANWFGALNMKKSAKYKLEIIGAASSVCIAYWHRVLWCANILAQEKQ